MESRNAVLAMSITSSVLPTALAEPATVFRGSKNTSPKKPPDLLVHFLRSVSVPSPKPSPKRMRGFQ